MIYPLLTLNDDTEYTFTGLQKDCTIIVYVETPDAVDGFHSLECVLPKFQFRNVKGYTIQEQTEILATIKANASKIQAMLDNLEDEYDAKVAKDAYNEYIQENKKSRPIAELWNELNI